MISPFTINLVIVAIDQVRLRVHPEVDGEMSESVGVEEIVVVQEDEIFSPGYLNPMIRRGRDVAVLSAADHVDALVLTGPIFQSQTDTRVRTCVVDENKL